MLNLTGVRLSRGGWPVLDRIDLSVAPGELVLVQGPNGIGKTTLLRTIAGLQDPDSGVIERPEAGLAYSGHLDGLKTALSVRENLSFWADIYGARSIDAALEAFDLRSLLRRRVASLSAGQRRRAGLARLVLSGASIWVMDEPTTSLDRANSARVVDALNAHVGAGGAAIVATHLDLGVAARVFDLDPFRATLSEVSE